MTKEQIIALKAWREDLLLMFNGTPLGKINEKISFSELITLLDDEEEEEGK